MELSGWDDAMWRGGFFRIEGKVKDEFEAGGGLSSSLFDKSTYFPFGANQN